MAPADVLGVAALRNLLLKLAAVVEGGETILATSVVWSNGSDVRVARGHYEAFRAALSALATAADREGLLG